jgi:hypothetical protein
VILFTGGTGVVSAYAEASPGVVSMPGASGIFARFSRAKIVPDSRNVLLIRRFGLGMIAWALSAPELNLRIIHTQENGLQKAGGCP